MGGGTSLKRIVKIILFLLLLTTSIFLFLNSDFSTVKDNFEEAEVPELQSKQVQKEIAIQFDEGVFSYMDKSTDEIVTLLGEPIRKDLTAYGYTWWIYY